MSSTIEDFNGGFGEKLWEREQWTDPEAIPHRKLAEDFEIGADSLPIIEGKVHFIRQVEGDGTISVLNEDFYVRKLFGYEYVQGIIDMKLEQLKGCYWEKKGEEAGLIEIYKYKIDENVSTSNLRVTDMILK